MGHKKLIIPLPLETPSDVSVDIQLACAFPDTAQSEILLLTTIDGGGSLQRASLVKQSSGLFRADIATTGDSMMYMVSIGDQLGTLIGATADRFELTPLNCYAGVVPVTNGHAIIEYHVPQQTAVAREMIRFHDSISTPAAFAGMQEKFKRYLALSDSSLQRHLRSGNAFGSFKYPWVEIADTLAHTAARVPDGLLRDELALETFECYSRAGIPASDARMVQLIARVSPTSLAWVYHGTLAEATKQTPGMGDSYFASIVDRHPWRSFAAFLLFQECFAAKQARDNSTLSTILTRLTTEFPNTGAASEAQDLYATRDLVRIGFPLPDFAFPSLDDPAEVFTNATFRGHHLLLVFWSTSCSPCVGEMPVLHKVYEKYRKYGLKILSVTLGNEPDRVQRFRKIRWPMPWSVTAVSQKNVGAVAMHFDAATPKHFLVDPAGKILMIDSLLYGSQLDSTLAHFLL